MRATVRAIPVPKPKHQLRWQMRPVAAAGALVALILGMALVSAPRAEAAALYTISGRITLPAGSPEGLMRSVKVVAQSDYQTVTVTPNPYTGIYVLKGLGRDSYTVQAVPVRGKGVDCTQINLAPKYFGTWDPETGATRVTLGPYNAANVNIAMQKGRTIAGTVSAPLDSLGQSQVGSVSVTAVSYEAGVTDYGMVNVDGTYTLSCLAPASDYVMIFEPGQSYDNGKRVYSPYGPSPLVAEFYDDSLTVDGATYVDVSSGNATGIDAELSLGASIEGKISLPAGAPTSWLRGIQVYAFNGMFERKGAVDLVTGEYRIPGLGPGAYQVFFSVDPFEDRNGQSATPNLLSEFYDNALTAQDNTEITVGTDDVTGIDATLEYAAAYAFTQAPTPTVSGAVSMGSTLMAIPGAWTPTPHTIAYQWTRNGVPIAGATGAQYVLTPDDAGTSVAVTVSASMNGYKASSRTSSAVAVPAQKFVRSGTASVSGSAVPGATLTVVDGGTWSPEPTSLLHQWYRDGVAVAGATGPTYVVDPADAGHQLSAVVAAQRPGFATARVATARVAVGWNSFTGPTSKPTVTGTLAPGGVVTASLKGVSPSPDSYAYQWYRDGVAITGARYYRYTLTSADAGKQVSVVITAKKVGYRSLAVASARVTVSP